jgi:perosamine synthetase
MDFFSTTVTPSAIRLVTETLQSGFLSEGRRVKEFESALESQLGLSRPVTTNSGTSALHLALLAAGVKEGDEVVTTPQTFVATSLSILHAGGRPVFADIDPSTGNISPESIKEKITDRTRAVLYTHWGGYPCDLAEIRKVCCGTPTHKYITPIADAAHALGATYHNNPIGGFDDFSDMSVFSFQAIKHVTSGGDGGCVASRIQEDADYVRQYRWFGIDRANAKETELGERAYELRGQAGFKFHMNDVSAACGLGNLDGFSERLARRRFIASRYFIELANVPGLNLMKYDSDRESSYWLFPIRVENRLSFVRALKAKGVPTSVVHGRIDKHQIFGKGVREDLVGQAIFEK